VGIGCVSWIDLEMPKESFRKKPMVFFISPANSATYDVLKIQVV
jgi:hypothetical protein